MAIGSNYTQKDRDEFYRRARQHSNAMNSLGEMRGEMRVQSFDNAYARFKYAQMQRDDIQLEDGRRREVEAQADVDGALAQSSNFMGDVFTGGAQRNLDEAYEAAEASKWKQALRQFGTAGVKVGWEGVKDASIGLVAGGLKLASKGAKLGKKVTSALGQGGEALETASRARAVKAGENFDKAREVREAYSDSRRG